MLSTLIPELLGCEVVVVELRADDKENDITYLQNEIQQLEGYLSRLGSNS